MRDMELPRAFLRDAWCRVRLDVIQEAVQEAIKQLEDLVRNEEETANGTASAPLPASSTARGAALRTCSQELRVECGLPVVPSPLAPPESRDAAWVFTYDESLLRYQKAAVHSLRRTLG